MIIMRIAKDVTAHFKFTVRVHEWIFGVLLFAIGIQLIRRDHMFADAPGWSKMAAVFDERVWGTIFISVSACRIMALTANGAFRKFRRYSPIVRMVCAYLEMGVWFVMALGTFEANSGGVVWLVAAALTLINLFLANIIGAEAGMAYRDFADDFKSGQRGG